MDRLQFREARRCQVPFAHSTRSPHRTRPRGRRQAKAVARSRIRSCRSTQEPAWAEGDPKRKELRVGTQAHPTTPRWYPQSAKRILSGRGVCPVQLHKQSQFWKEPQVVSFGSEAREPGVETALQTSRIPHHSTIPLFQHSIVPRLQSRRRMPTTPGRRWVLKNLASGGGRHYNQVGI